MITERDRLADEVARAFGPLEWFTAEKNYGLATRTNWPGFDDATAREIATKLNDALRPYVLEQRKRLLHRLNNWKD